MSASVRNRRSGDRDGGYILVEALATLALSALVLGGLLSLSAILLKAADGSAARVERLETEPRAVAAIAREIRQAARLRYAGDGDRFIFLGLPDRIVIVIRPIEPNGLRTAVAVAYQAAEPGTVLRAEAPVGIGAARLGDLAFAAPRAISTGSALIRFAYIERGQDGGEIVTDDWSRPTALPASVRIDRVSADGRVLGSLRAPLVITAEPGCAGPVGKAFCSHAPKSEGAVPVQAPRATP